MLTEDRTPQPTKFKQKKERSTGFKVFGVVLVIIGIGIILYLLFLANTPGFRNDDVSLLEINRVSRENPVVLYFWSGGCSYCEDQKSIIEDLEQDYEDENVTFYWLDYSKHKDLTDHYNIRGFPTTVLVNNASVQKKFVGFTGYESIAEELDAALESYK